MDNASTVYLLFGSEEIRLGSVADIQGAPYQARKVSRKTLGDTSQALIRTVADTVDELLDNNESRVGIVIEIR